MPEYFPWSADISVGIEEIDAQHKVLIHILNGIYQAIVTQAPRQATAGLLEELVQYTHVHFAVEESLFRITDYPAYEGHKAIHDHLKQQVEDIRAKFQRGEIVADLALMDFLKQWLEQHIKGEDKTYVPHLLQAGLAKKWAKTSWIGKIWGK